MKVSDIYVVPIVRKTVKMQYLGSNKLYAWTLFRVFIAQQGLHDAQIPNLKARGKLGAFPPELRLDLYIL
jgi:hypothetical protein